MDFSADTKSLGEALDQIQGAVEKKNTIPILSHCLVEAESRGLRLAATDLEVGIRLFCAARVSAQGSGALPARRLLEIVRSLPDGDVRIRTLAEDPKLMFQPATRAMPLPVHGCADPNP